MKTWPWKSKLSGSLTMCVYTPSVISAGVVTKNFPQYLREYKAKTIPLQAWTSLEGSRRLRIPDFKTFGT
jgi:hypothetical protein